MIFKNKALVVGKSRACLNKINFYIKKKEYGKQLFFNDKNNSSN